MEKHKFLIAYVENFVRGYDCKERVGGYVSALPFINFRKDLHFRSRRSNMKLIEVRASIDGRNPILSNRLSSSLYM